MSKHTKEPWPANCKISNRGDLMLRPQEGGVFEFIENRERAAACVNALAGLNPEAVKDVVEAAKAAYRFLAPFNFNWPGRTTTEGQSLLCDLLHAIVDVTGCDEREFYEECRMSKNAALAKIGGGE